MIQLHQEQTYVQKIATELGIEARLIEHKKPTRSCADKAALLDWPTERIVKALYFSHYGSMIGIITPETGEPIRTKSLLPEALGISKTKAGNYRMGALPKGMEFGTCSPFPHDSTIPDEVEAIIIREVPDLDDMLVDISVGGRGYQAQKTSMHLPYGAIRDILKTQFGERVHKVRF